MNILSIKTKVTAVFTINITLRMNLFCLFYIRKIKKIISIKDLLPRKVNEYKHVEHVETY